MTREEIKKIMKFSADDKTCNLCRESSMPIGKTGYGSLIYKIGNKENGWFATLSPKTGGDAAYDFTVQLMPFAHLTHFSQIDSGKKLSENFGIAFAKISKSMPIVMMQDKKLFADADK